jgi:hypothetical protein
MEGKIESRRENMTQLNKVKLIYNDKLKPQTITIQKLIVSQLVFTTVKVKLSLFIKP